MRVAFVITRSDIIGGAQIHVRDLATALQRAGAHPHVLVGTTGPFVQMLRGRGIDVRSVPSLVRPIAPMQDLSAMRELRQLLATLRPDLVSTHSSKAGTLGRIVAHRTGIPSLFTAHGWAFADGVPAPKQWMYRSVERTIAPFSAQIITVSRHDRDLAIRHRIAAPDRIVAIHNGMPDVGRQHRALPGREPCHMVMIARFEPQKDHASLFAALEGLRDRAWTLTLVGDGSGRVAAEAWVAAHGLTHRIRFVRSSDSVEAILAAASVYVLATRWEGFPRSIIEAFRAGLPVIASRVGGVPEAVEDGKNGFLVSRADVHGLRDRLRVLIDDPELRASMGRRAREHYESHLTFDAMFDTTTNVYESVARARPNVARWAA